MEIEFTSEFRYRNMPLPAHTLMFLGRQFNYPVALEGALKMKEATPSWRRFATK